eukprot:CAMPEP_0204632496 /NCGR_PEP_ID=MMETSP0717-20131115/25114_1 /ASSEMBLY_ACC=CAM_ASM_000666 /TAXON_ID=230516 /ORGANISM="Chaetoceros curvisetus" /LENGTH=156 /DNA_ID=CAMNT_0051650377 /DNA_START=662 /DNA_END=1129 /DNA_ORIENTATION=+
MNQNISPPPTKRKTARSPTLQEVVQGALDRCEAQIKKEQMYDVAEPYVDDDVQVVGKETTIETQTSCTSIQDNSNNQDGYQEETVGGSQETACTFSFHQDENTTNRNENGASEKAKTDSKISSENTNADTGADVDTDTSHSDQSLADVRFEKRIKE